MANSRGPDTLSDLVVSCNGITAAPINGDLVLQFDGSVVTSRPLDNLTTIDAGAMPLDLKEVDIRSAVDAAALGLQDRIAEKAVLLDVRTQSRQVCLLTSFR